MKLLIAKIVFCSGVLCFGIGAQAQSSPRPAAPTRKAAAVAGHTECVQTVGLCVTVPDSWQRLGDVFEGLGFVVAESRPGPGADTATWPQITVAAMDVPEQKNGGAPSLDSLVDTVLAPGGSFTSETLQRTRLLLNGNEAEIVRIREHDEASKTDVIEAVALIVGDDGLVYSIALRCPPQDFARLEPIFQKTVHSWRVKPPAPETQSKQDLEKK